METGYIYQKTEEEIKKDVKEGKNIYVGVYVNSLMDTINLLEANNLTPSQVVAELKKEILYHQGKIEVKDEKE